MAPRIAQDWERMYAHPILWSAKIPFEPRQRRLSSLLDQVILMMYAAKDRGPPDAVSGWQLVPVVTRRNTLLTGFRNAKP